VRRSRPDLLHSLVQAYAPLLPDRAVGADTPAGYTAGGSPGMPVMSFLGARGGAGLDEGLGGRLPVRGHRRSRAPHMNTPGEQGQGTVGRELPVLHRAASSRSGRWPDELSLRGEEQVLDVGCGRGAVLSSGEGCGQSNPRSPRRGTPLAVTSIGGVVDADVFGPSIPAVLPCVDGEEVSPGHTRWPPRCWTTPASAPGRSAKPT
jgi:hypothetical protein